MVILNMCQKWGGWVGPSAILDHMVNGPHGVLDFFIATHLANQSSFIIFFFDVFGFFSINFYMLPLYTASIA